jgi:hypothetical protein
MRVRSSIAALGFLVAVAAPALADHPGQPKTYGTQHQTSLTLGPCDAVNRDPAAPFAVFNCDFLTANVSGGAAGSALAGFPLHLPEGALIEEVRFAYYDTVSGAEPVFVLHRTGLGLIEQIANDAFPVFEGGNNTAIFVVDPPHEVVNNGLAYSLAFHADTVDATHFQGLYAVTIRYRLQVSPAPATATFTDVPTGHAFFQFIEALAASGITGGCGNGKYCPDNPVTRGQMAVFLAKALGLQFPDTSDPK